MLYRKFGKTGEKVSLLGFGAMRLPIIDKDESKINEPEAMEQIRYAIDNGVNYIDTAYPYHYGASEPFVAKVLKDGYREKVKLATKLPSWLIEKEDDMEKILDEQLQRLEVDYIDFYLIHALNATNWPNLKKHNIFKFMENAKASGKIKHIGFSFHDELPVFKEIVDAFDWDFCQVQYNFMDENYQAGLEGLEYAAAKNMGIVVMEPLRGGSLENNIPDDVQEIWDSAEIDRSPAQWSLKYIWNHPSVHVILSGMNAIEQIDENIAAASDTMPNSLTKKELSIINKVKKIYINRTAVNCTACKYCMPCPFGVNIPECFKFLNNSSMYQDVAGQKRVYNLLVKPENRASICTQCGVCESKCPQNIPIRDMLKKVVEVFGE